MTDGHISLFGSPGSERTVRWHPPGACRLARRWRV
jgi:hypothetical protein